MRFFGRFCAKEIGLVGFGFLTLLCAYLYILSLVVNPQHAWMLPEAYFFKFHIVKNIPIQAGAIAKESLNTAIFEWSPRLTRPLSSMFEILDTHFRVWLWSFTSPSASISLTYLASLIAIPLLFLLTLLRFQIRLPVALVSTALLILQPTMLSLVVMNFRPAKTMINLCLVFVLYLIAGQNGRFLSRLRLLSIGLAIFLAFLFDETALAIVLIILVLEPNVFIANLTRAAGFLSVPFLLSFLYLKGLPDLATWVGFDRLTLSNYSNLGGSQFPPFTILSLNLAQNVALLFRESFGLFAPWRLPNLAMALTQCLLIGVLCSTFFTAANYRQKLFQSKPNLIKIAALLLGLSIFHSVLMNMTGDHIKGRVWGLYWYGGYLNIIFALFVASLAEAIARINERRLFILITLIALICVVQSQVFPYLNFQYRKFHFFPYQPLKIETYFRNPEARFEEPKFHIFADHRKISDAIGALQRGETLNEIAKDLFFIPLEKGAFKNDPQPSLSTLMTPDDISPNYLLPLPGCLQRDCIR